jgi:hypothetical protein
MSIDHTFEVGCDDSCKVFLNISGVSEGGHDTAMVSANLYAYDRQTGTSKFTCCLTLKELSGLYHHLSKYSMVREIEASITGKFVEVTGKTEELLSVLSVAHDEALISKRLTNNDVNTILGRRDSLQTFKVMLENSDSYSEAQWQEYFENNEWIFGYGLKYKYLKILQREAHISRTDLGGGNDVISDFMLSDTRFTKLVELKTPATSLFENRRNRSDSWRLSSSLTDAVSQILAQKANWELEGSGHNYTSSGERIVEAAYNVECILIIGKHTNIQGTDREIQMKSKTLELYRRNLRNIEILLFDELYDRARFIVEGE